MNLPLLLAGPILPGGEPSLYLIGYFPPNAFHNPTMLVAKPLLILVFACAVASVTRAGRPSWRELALIAVPVVLLGAAKPNYLGCVVPVVIVIASDRAAKRDVPGKVASICVMPATPVRVALYPFKPLERGRPFLAPLRFWRSMLQ